MIKYIIAFVLMIFLLGCAPQQPVIEIVGAPDEITSGEEAVFVWRINPPADVEHTNIHTSFSPGFEERIDSEKQSGKGEIYMDTVTLQSDSERVVYVKGHANVAGENIESQVQEIRIVPIKSPVEGFSLHIDAKRHVASDRTLVAHHYCKSYPEGFFECQLFDSDEANARLIGVEVVIGSDLYDQVSDEEKPNWHHHDAEIARAEVDIQLPDLSEEEASAVAEALRPTYGKILIVWDPNDPVPKQPQVVIV